ncbi:MAG: rnhB, partial [Blastococcus sp.]|nr:rnhB [Blastococcus sp.]
MAVRTLPTHTRSASGGRAGAGLLADERGDALWAMERSLRRRGFPSVAGADEAGRGACAG